MVRERTSSGILGSMRRALVVIVALAVVGSAAFYLGTRNQSGQPSASNGKNGQAVRNPENPLGVFFNPRMYDIQKRVQMAEELGVHYFRTFPVLVPAWNGQCTECAPVHDAGLQFVLTLRNAPSYTAPSQPVTDANAFKKSVGEILDQYKPALVVVENEENTPKYFTGSASQYASELKDACDVAHEHHVKCTNGGILGESVAWIVYFHYIDSGQTSAARSFSQRAMSAQVQQQLAAGSDQEGHTVADRTLALVNSYKPSGADYVNFHWYLADPQALQQSADYMKQLTGLPVLTNEIGQRNTDPATTTAILSMVVQLKLPFAVWFSSDARLSKALIDPDGSLRPTGTTFESFATSHFG
jgi:hypothetical protein